MVKPVATTAFQCINCGRSFGDEGVAETHEKICLATSNLLHSFENLQKTLPGGENAELRSLHDSVKQTIFESYLHRDRWVGDDDQKQASEDQVQEALYKVTKCPMCKGKLEKIAARKESAKGSDKILSVFAKEYFGTRDNIEEVKCKKCRLTLYSSKSIVLVKGNASAQRSKSE